MTEPLKSNPATEQTARLSLIEVEQRDRRIVAEYVARFNAGKGAGDAVDR